MNTLCSKCNRIHHALSDCPKIFYVKLRELDDEEFLEIFAHDARDAAEEYARWHNRENLLTHSDDAIEVIVKDDSGNVTKFTAYAAVEIQYHIKKINQQQ